LFNKQSLLPERGGFWRRLGALFVDALIIAVGLQLLGIPAYEMSGGRVQSDILSHTISHNLSAVPAAVKIPSESEPNYIYECVGSWFGFPTAQWITVIYQPQPQAAADTEAIVLVDADGQPLGDFSLDLQMLLIPVLLVYRIGCERRRGQTIGKRLTRVRVIQIAPGTGRFSPAIKRNLALFLPMIFTSLAPIEMPRSLWLELIAAVIFCGVFGGVIVWQIATRRDTYYDKAAGTAVVRVTAHSPPVTVRASAA